MPEVVSRTSVSQNRNLTESRLLSFAYDFGVTVAILSDITNHC